MGDIRRQADFVLPSPAVRSLFATENLSHVSWSPVMCTHVIDLGIGHSVYINHQPNKKDEWWYAWALKAWCGSTRYNYPFGIVKRIWMTSLWYCSYFTCTSLFSENTELTDVLVFKAWIQSGYSHSCFAYCQVFLPCSNFYLLGPLIFFFFSLSKSCPYFSTALVLANAKCLNQGSPLAF